jgi:hypothetical protein
VCYHLLLPFSNFVMSTFTTEDECCCAHAVHANHFLSNSESVTTTLKVNWEKDVVVSIDGSKVQ